LEVDQDDLQFFKTVGDFSDDLSEISSIL